MLGISKMKIIGTYAYFGSRTNLFDPAGRTRHNHEAANRTSKLKSNDYNLLNINILYLCNCALLKSELSITYAHATFDKCYPSSVTNCHKSRTPSPICHTFYLQISNSQVSILN